MKKALNLSAPKYKKMSEMGIEHIRQNYNFEDYEKNWISLIDRVIEEEGAWENRKNYKTWRLLEVA